MLKAAAREPNSEITFSIGALILNLEDAHSSGITFGNLQRKALIIKVVAPVAIRHIFPITATLNPVIMHTAPRTYSIPKITIGVFHFDNFANPFGSHPSSHACIVGLGAQANWEFKVEINANPAPQIIKNT